MASSSSTWSRSLCSNTCNAPPSSPPSIDLTNSTEMNGENKGENESEEQVEEDFHHLLQPGDHVIRWEMLPIVYPIQIHGIVLETGDDFVTIADFGLTAYQQEEEETETGRAPTERSNVEEEREEKEALEKADETDNDESTITKEVKQEGDDDDDDDDVNEDSADVKQSLKDSTVQQQKLSAESTSFHLRKVMDNKSRLNVTTIRNPKEIKSWKKVNYGENMFTKSLKKSQSSSSWWRMGSMKSKAGEETAAEEEGTSGNGNEEEIGQVQVSEKGEETADDASFVTASSELAHEGKADTAVENGMTACQDESSAQATDIINGEDTLDEEEMMGKAAVQTSSTVDEPNVRKERRSWWGSRKASSSVSKSSNPQQDENEQGTSSKPGWWKSWTTSSKNDYQVIPKDQAEKEEIAWADAGRPQLSQRPMNPAMSSLLHKSDEKQLSPKRKQQKLPKADPPKVVLARTRFLLEHGESVLPPYHVFASNSECIAVWCMTGRWSTLQASVFLHSTAIGHAKTATAITLGVAATQPWLVPALAVVGGAAVGMPWIILKRSKDRWEEATIRLNDLFWSQAEPEVFVECIEKWSKLRGGAGKGRGSSETKEAVVESA